MLQLETPFSAVNADVAAVYALIAKADNLKSFMPEQVINWTADEDYCKFTIKGMADLQMRITERVENQMVKYDSEGKVPFPFSLIAELRATAEGKSEARILFNGDINMFMRMMAEKPLQNFIQLIVQGLQKHFAQVA